MSEAMPNLPLPPGTRSLDKGAPMFDRAAFESNLKKNALRGDSGTVEIGQRLSEPANEQVDERGVDDFFGDLNDDNNESSEPARTEDVSGVRAQSRTLISEEDVDRAVARLGESLDLPPGTRPLPGAALRTEPFSKTDPEGTRVLSRAELAAVIGDAERKTDDAPKAKVRKNPNELARGASRPAKPAERSADPVEIFDRAELERQKKRLPSIAEEAIQDADLMPINAEEEARINDEQIRKQRAKLAYVKVPELPRLQVEKPKAASVTVPELPAHMRSNQKSPLSYIPAQPAPPFTNRPAVSAPMPDQGAVTGAKKEPATALQRLGAWLRNPFKKAA